MGAHLCEFTDNTAATVYCVSLYVAIYFVEDKLETTATSSGENMATAIPQKTSII